MWNINYNFVCQTVDYSNDALAVRVRATFPDDYALSYVLYQSVIPGVAHIFEAKGALTVY